MKFVKLGNTGIEVPAIVVGCMRFARMSDNELNHFVHLALDNKANYFDHADIYGGGRCEENFGRAIMSDKSIKREDLTIQTKCAINRHTEVTHYNFTKDYILSSVDASLKRLNTDYLDVLLLHRPDALCDPYEVAEAFDKLKTSGKVLKFGVSNHKPMQIELLKKAVKEDLIINQLQFSIPVSNMVASGMEVNMTTSGAYDRDGSVLDYSRINDMTIQAWSPFQMPRWMGPFIGSMLYPRLNKALKEIASEHNTTPTAIATAWITTHPANMQVIAGTTTEERLKQIIGGSEIKLSHDEWYKLYKAAGHRLP